MESDKPPRPTRWFQFSLKSLLLVFLLVASFFAGRASVESRLRRLQLEAVMQREIAEQQRAAADRQRVLAEMRALEAIAAARRSQQDEVLGAAENDAVRSQRPDPLAGPARDSSTTGQEQGPGSRGRSP